MPKLNVIYGKEFDIQRVKDTIKRIDWYVENKYNYKNFPFPKTLDKEKLKSYSDEEIKEAVIVEYNEDLYKENEKILINNWERISGEIELVFSKSNLLFRNEYNI